MAEDMIRYDVLAQDALRGLVRKVLSEVEKTGLPGEHHFFVTFDTNHPGARISQRLRADYPNDMTIVLQHQFWDLKVNDTGFEIGLSFKGIPEHLVVPFAAVTSFVDPHASFALKFDLSVETAAQEPVKPKAPEPATKKANDAPAAEGPAEAKPEAAAAVVSLDAFRKKNA